MFNNSINRKLNSYILDINAENLVLEKENDEANIIINEINNLTVKNKELKEENKKAKNILSELINKIESFNKNNSSNICDSNDTQKCIVHEYLIKNEEKEIIIDVKEIDKDNSVKSSIINIDIANKSNIIGDCKVICSKKINIICDNCFIKMYDGDEKKYEKMQSYICSNCYDISFEIIESALFHRQKIENRMPKTLAKKEHKRIICSACISCYNYTEYDIISSLICINCKANNYNVIFKDKENQERHENQECFDEYADED